MASMIEASRLLPTVNALESANRSPKMAGEDCSVAPGSLPSAGAKAQSSAGAAGVQWFRVGGNARRYKFTVDNCMHGASCTATARGDICTHGKRIKEETLVTGARALAGSRCSSPGQNPLVHPATFWMPSQ